VKKEVKEKGPKAAAKLNVPTPILGPQRPPAANSSTNYAQNDDDQDQFLCPNVVDVALNQLFAELNGQDFCGCEMIRKTREPEYSVKFTKQNRLAKRKKRLGLRTRSEPSPRAHTPSNR